MIVWLLRILVAFSLGFAVPSLLQAAAPPHGEIIEAVELRAASPAPFSFDFESAIALQIGAPVDRDQVARTLENLWASHLVEDARIFFEDSTAVVYIEFKTYIAAIEVRTPILQRALKRRVLQRPETVLDPSLVEQSRSAIVEHLQSLGFLDARVEARIERITPSDNFTSSSSLIFEVQNGRRYTFRELSLEGEIADPVRQRASRWSARRAGKPYLRQQVTEVAQKLRSWLSAEEYLAANISAPEVFVDSASGSVDLSFRIDSGPRITVEISGARLKALRPAPFLQNGRYHLALVSESCERLTERLQRRGFYRARVSFREHLTSKGKTLAIDVSRGPKARVDTIELTGNSSFSSERLKRYLATNELRPWRPTSGYLVDAELEEDLAGLLSFYRLSGFPEARVGSATVTEESRPGSDVKRLRVEIPIEEGRRQRIVDVAVTVNGNPADQQTTDLISTHLESGGPYHPAHVDDAIRRLRTHFERSGYWSPIFTTTLDWNSDQSLVDVRLDLDLGHRTRLGKIVYRGLTNSRTRALDKLTSLRQGQYLSRGHLLQAEQALYRLGVFDRVEVEDLRTAARHRRVDIDTNERVVDIVIDAKERRPWRLGYGLSYHSEEGLGGLLDIARFNLRGLGDRLQLQARGNSGERRFLLTYDQPVAVDRRLPVSYSIYRLDQDRESFEVENLGARVSLRRQLGRTRAALIFDHRLVDLSEETIDPSDLERQDREIDITTITPQIFIDRRNDPLDPTDGWSSTYQLQWAVPIFAETEFLKFFGQQTWYHSIPRAGTIAISGRLGAIEPLNPEDAPPDPLVPPDLPNSLVPISERFFGGGRTSHRAYERDTLGILEKTLFRVGDEIVESGGNGLAILNLDYRFPIAGSIGGTLFFDFGNIWADWRDIDPEEFAAGVGAGLRYLSPIGPVRLDVGWKLDREPGQRDPVFFLSFGHAF